MQTPLLEIPSLNKRLLLDIIKGLLFDMLQKKLCDLLQTSRLPDKKGLLLDMNKGILFDMLRVIARKVYLRILQIGVLGKAMRMMTTLLLMVGLLFCRCV